MMENSESKPVQIRISAPGKVILFGEHSVVYHKAAIAATLDLRTELNLIETQSGYIDLKLSALDWQLRIPVSALQFNGNDISQEQLRALLDQLCPSSTKASHHLALHVFLNSYFKMAAPVTGLDVCIKSQLVLGSGQGSSASYSLVLATAFTLLGLVKTSVDLSQYMSKTENGWLMTSALTKIITENVFSCEQLVHGTPSGLDHTIELLGSAVRYVKEQPPKLLQWSGALRILMVDTKVPRITKNMTGKVKDLKDNWAGIIDGILEAMHHVALSAAQIIEAPPVDFDLQFAQLIRLNHGLLRTLGVSHPALENIVSISERRGFSAKLTGAGGGGFAFVFLPRVTPADSVHALTKELEEQGYDVVDANLAGNGLQIHQFVS